MQVSLYLVIILYYNTNFNVIVNLLSYFAVGFGTRSCFPFWGEVICWLPGGLGAPKISNNTLIVILLSIQ